MSVHLAPLLFFRQTPIRQSWPLMEKKPMSCFSIETYSGVTNLALQDLAEETAAMELHCQEMTSLLTVDLISDQTSLGFGCLEWTSTKFYSQHKVHTHHYVHALM